MEFKPKIFDEQTTLFLIAFPIVILGVLIILFSTTSFFDKFMVNMSAIHKILLLDGIITGLYTCVQIVLNYVGKNLNEIKVTKDKITVKSNDKIINPKVYNFNTQDIQSIQFKWNITKSSGKLTLSRYLYWLVIKLKNGEESTIEMHAFDSSTLKQALHYISSEHTSIEIEPKYIETQPWKGEVAELFHSGK